MPVNEEDCPCFYGGSCPSDYKHKDQPVFDCPECGWVTEHYSHCKIAEVDQLNNEDIYLITHALEVFLVHQTWDGANRMRIEQVLKKASRLRSMPL
jgi:hypothetical protein